MKKFNILALALVLSDVAIAKTANNDDPAFRYLASCETDSSPCMDPYQCNPVITNFGTGTGAWYSGCTCPSTAAGSSSRFKMTNLIYEWQKVAGCQPNGTTHHDDSCGDWSSCGWPFACYGEDFLSDDGQCWCYGDSCWDLDSSSCVPCSALPPSLGATYNNRKKYIIPYKGALATANITPSIASTAQVAKVATPLVNSPVPIKPAQAIINTKQLGNSTVKK